VAGNEPSDVVKEIRKKQVDRENRPDRIIEVSSKRCHRNGAIMIDAAAAGQRQGKQL
jgi:hypothetical protein